MGFQEAQVTKAMRATKNAGLTQACVPSRPGYTSDPHEAGLSCPTSICSRAQGESHSDPAS
jgi:hypothetical protein